MCAGALLRTGKVAVQRWDTKRTQDEQSGHDFRASAAYRGGFFHLRNANERFCRVCGHASALGWNELGPCALSWHDASIDGAGLSGGECELERRPGVLRMADDERTTGGNDSWEGILPIADGRGVELGCGHWRNGNERHTQREKFKNQKC